MKNVAEKKKKTTKKSTKVSPSDVNTEEPANTTVEAPVEQAVEKTDVVEKPKKSKKEPSEKKEVAPEVAENPPVEMNADSKLATKTKSNKKKRVNGDEPKPKRVKNAFMWYSSEIRASVKEELGTNSVSEIAKAIGERWNKLDETARAPYVKMYEDAKAALVEVS
jgi:hypothetical protein